MKAKKLPSGSWRARVFSHVDESGKKVYKSFTAETKAEAEFLANKFKFDRKENTSCGLTVGEAIDHYIKDRDSVLSPSTIASYKRYRKLYLQPLMNIQLDKLTQTQVQKAVNAEARNASSKTIRNAHALITSVLTANAIDLTLHTILPQRNPKDIAIPTDEQIKQLLGAHEDPQFRVAVILAAMLGLRRGEICALTRADIDRETATVNINKSMVLDINNKWHIKPPKTKSGHRRIKTDIWIVDAALALPIKGDRLLEWNPSQLSWTFDRTKKRIGINCRFHDLRHYNASVMLALGIPDKYAMERMGHATPNMLKAVYQHTMKEKQDEVADMVSDYFSKLKYDTEYDTSQK